MKPVPDDDLILHLFGDADDPAAIEAALATSPELRERLAGLRSTLELVDQDPLPPRPADYGATVWRRVKAGLPLEMARQPRQALRRLDSIRWGWAAAAAAVALLGLGLGFVVGRQSASPAPGDMLAEAGPDTAAGDSPTTAPGLSARGRERLLVAALADHLGHSERLLTEVSNASSTQPDPALEQQWATELLAANRLYQRAAEQAGQARIARLLAELEPVFLELAHSAGGPDEEWRDLQRRIDQRGLLFKVRVTEARLAPETAATAGRV